MAERDDNESRRGRRLALISVSAAFAFIGIEFAGASLGWSNQVMGLLELGVCAVFLWVIIKAVRLWRERRAENDR